MLRNNPVTSYIASFEDAELQSHHEQSRESFPELDIEVFKEN
jgi:hypothetical protein